ncbi:hypothetical protein GJ496_003004 [Pomphorhynchus laevis]|nr:hypothetical protein GJ496_003004 [Pomphorhynchus laevis]
MANTHVCVGVPSSPRETTVYLEVQGSGLVSIIDSANSTSFINDNIVSGPKLKIHKISDQISLATHNNRSYINGQYVVNLKLYGCGYKNIKLGVI